MITVKTTANAHIEITVVDMATEIITITTTTIMTTTAQAEVVAQEAEITAVAFAIYSVDVVTK